MKDEKRCGSFMVFRVRFVSKEIGATSSVDAITGEKLDTALRI
jgi:hypothetical protein